MQGFNMGRYYGAPDDSAGAPAPSFNTASHPLGARARKLASDGILVVRFELPFAVWCDGCRQRTGQPCIIGQGVRFNAEKRRVGAYHSTPVWEFGLKHPACGGRIVVRTDPANAEYVVESGGKRRDTGAARVAGGSEGEAEAEGGGEILTPEERERRRNDAFAAFEGKKADKVKKKAEEDRIEELRRVREKDWADPYAANKKLRRPFREKRKEWEKEEGVKEELQERFGIGFEIADEREEDRKRAKLIEFGAAAAGDGGVESAALKAARRPLFDAASSMKDVPSPKAGAKGKTKAARAAELSKKLLEQELKGNTRAKMDPFLLPSEKTTPNGSHIIAGLKRKRTTTGNDDLKDGQHGDCTKTGKSPSQEPSEPPPREKKQLLLVDYDSDE